jgi:hypothetical protein
MVTFGVLKARVLTRVIDTPTAVQNEVPRLVNEAIRQLARDHDFDVMRAMLSVNTTVGVRTLVAKPANWKKPRQDRPWRESKEGFVDFMGWLPTQEEAFKLYSAATDATDKGAPKWLRLANPTDVAGSQSIEVFPLPDGQSKWVTAPAGEYRVRVPYWASPADLVADADTNWFTDNAALYIEFWTAGQAFSLDEDELREKKMMAYAQDQERSLLSQEKKTRLGAMRQLRIRTSVFAPRTQGRL